METSVAGERRVVVMQPYFLPYRNYFGLIRRCDEFVIFDDVQFCHKWQQRNWILAASGEKEWLTAPVVSRRPDRQRICDVMLVDDRSWRPRLLQRVRAAYGTHRCFDEVFAGFERVVSTHHERLVDLTVDLLQWATAAIGLPPPVWRWSSDHPGDGLVRNGRLIDLCRRFGATEYISGPAAKVYLREDLFADAGIHVVWHEEQYEPYPQAGTTAFDHFVSILDLLMNHGSASARYLRPIAAPPEPLACRTLHDINRA